MINRQNLNEKLKQRLNEKLKQRLNEKQKLCGNYLIHFLSKSKDTDPDLIKTCISIILSDNIIIIITITREIHSSTTLLHRNRKYFFRT
jgi:hypothetical protein